MATATLEDKTGYGPDKEDLLDLGDDDFVTQLDIGYTESWSGEKEEIELVRTQRKRDKKGWDER